MENSFHSGLAGGDTEAKAVDPSLKRDQDSVDDFEHLEGEAKRDDFTGSPLHSAASALSATQSFLDTEREELFVKPSRVTLSDSSSEKLVDHIADKFTDSESDDTAGDSPMHRGTAPQPTLPPVAEIPKPQPKVDPTPPLVPTHSAPEPKPEIETPKPEPVAAPKEPSAPPKELVAPTKELAAPPKEPAAPPKESPAPPKEPAAPPKEPAAPPKEPAASPKAPAVPPKVTETPPPPPARPPAHVIEAEVIFCQMGLDAWFDPQRLHPKVESLIYWRDPARAGAALGAGLAILVALACCSVVSVLAYVSLLALSAAVAFRVYKNVLQAVQKTSEGHPFKWLLEKEISVPAERAQSLAAAATAHLNATVNELRRLFLVEDLVDSLKFGVLLWCFTYVGACFNGITLIILGWIALFTLPKAYEMNKAQVDANLELARGKINEISAKVRAAVPLGKKSESEKDK